MNTAVAGDPFERGPSAAEGLPWMSWRWGLCFIAVVALHIGVAWIVLRWGPNGEPALPPLPPAAVMIDLALPPGPDVGPRSARPPGPPREPGPVQGVEPTTPAAPQVQKSEPPPEAPPAPVEVPEPPLPASPVPAPAPALVHPSLPSAPPVPAPQIAVPMPPRPKPETKPTPKPNAIAPHRPVAHRAPPAPMHAARSPAAAVAARAGGGGLPGRAGIPGVPPGRGPVGQAGSAPPGGGGTGAAMPSTAAVSNWHGRLLARLEEFKHYPASALQRQEQGVVDLRFTIDRGGNVLSASVARSSSVGALDREALALIRRAAPLPAPPPDVVGNAISMVVPVTFRLE